MKVPWIGEITFGSLTPLEPTIQEELAAKLAEGDSLI